MHSIADDLTDFTLKLWTTVLQNQQSSAHAPTVFSYEITASCYFELCSLYSSLFYNPESLLIICTKKMKTLLEMIEQISFPNHALSSNHQIESTHSLVVRLKFINNILTDQHLFEICNR